MTMDEIRVINGLLCDKHGRVLEIKTDFVPELSLSTGINVKINLNIDGIDDAIEKAQRYAELLAEANKLANELSKIKLDASVKPIKKNDFKISTGKLDGWI